MTRPLIRIHNTSTDEVIDREMTEEEYSAFLREQELVALEKEKLEKVEADKLAAQAKLAALGLTTEDLKALGL